MPAEKDFRRMTIFKKAILIMLSLLAGYLLLTVLIITPRVEGLVMKLEEEKARESLSKAVAIVDNVYDDLDTFRRHSLQLHKNELKDLTDTLYSLVRLHYDRFRAEPTAFMDEKKKTLDLISRLRYDDDDYFFAIDYHNVLVAHPYLRNRDFSNIRDVKGNLIVPPMVEIAREKGAGFYTYWWKKNKKDDHPYPKLSYVRNFAPWKIVVGTGAYTDDIDREMALRKAQLMSQLKRMLSATHVGTSGYVFIFDGKGRMLIHPNRALVGRDISHLKNPGKDEYLFDDLIHAAKTTGILRYKWDKPSDKGNYIYDKVAWIVYIPKLDWYVAATAYMDDLRATSLNIEKAILLASVGFFGMAVLLGGLFFQRILRPISQLSHGANRVADGDYTARVQVDTKDEIGLLAANFNKMVDSIQDYAENLDQKVEDRTRELELQRSFIQAVMDSQPNIVITTDGHTIRAVNKSFLSFFEVEDIDGFRDRYGACICNTFVENRKGFLRKMMGEETWMEYILARPNEIHKALIRRGEKVHIFTVAAHRFDFHDETLMTAVLTDITEIEEMRRELEEAKQRAEESTQSKSKFLANMSHEIRTPMNGIIGMAHLTLQTELSDLQRGYIEKIERSAESLLGIINDILDFSKIEAGRLTMEEINFDLFQLIANIVTMLEPKVREKGIDLIVDYDPALGKEFRGDSLRIGQVLTNLVSNAVKFTQRGEVKIAVRKMEGERIRFEVKDTGIGLSKEEQARLFLPFSQADESTTRRYGGTGLGLSISRRLVEMMNGSIWVESIKGLGSNFTFEIELKKPDKDRERWTMFSGRRALVVDDSHSWLEVLRHLLEGFGMAVDLLDSGPEAVARLKAGEIAYDVVLLDWLMPELDGIQVAETLRATMKETPPLILVTAYVDPEMEKKAMEAGLRYILEKPVNPSRLNDLLSDLFLGTQKMRRSRRTKVHEEHLQRSMQALRGSHIMLVEDNETNRDVVVGLLQNSGIRITSASDGREAVEKFESLDDLELILMDIQMPVMDGYEATRLIRERDDKIPIIALSANAMKEDVQRSLDAGMNDHLNKPIEVAKLYEILLKYLSKGEVTEGEEEMEQRTPSPREGGLPEFKTLDKERGLSLIMGNEQVYRRILEGLNKYRHLRLDEVKDPDEFERIVHTIKGLSASAGAHELHRVAERLDKTADRSLIPQFHRALRAVVEELEESGLFGDAEDSSNETEGAELSKEMRDRLFEELLEACRSRRPKKVRPILKEIERYRLNPEDATLFKEVKGLVERYRFKEAVEALRG